MSESSQTSQANLCHVKRCSCVGFSLKAGRKDLTNRPKVLSPQPKPLPTPPPPPPDGFYPIGSKFGTKWPNMWSQKVSPIFDFRPETRDIPTRVKNGTACYKPCIQIRISSEWDKISKIRDTLFQISILEVQKIIQCDPPNNLSGLELAKLDHLDLQTITKNLAHVNILHKQGCSSESVYKPETTYRLFGLLELNARNRDLPTPCREGILIPVPTFIIHHHRLEPLHVPRSNPFVPHCTDNGVNK